MKNINPLGLFDEHFLMEMQPLILWYRNQKKGYEQFLLLNFLLK
jgi:hypothetical protein